MNRTMLFLLAALILTPLPAMAQAQAQDQKPKPIDRSYKDSLDYTMDDGVMSEEEMMAEAQQMYSLCDMNAYQKVYFNCSCLAGAFLQQREKLGPLVTQDEIFTTITNSAQVSPSCANTEYIAGKAYESCRNFRSNYARTEISDDNVDYCTCVANKMANDFGTQPRLSGQYVETLRFNAMRACEDPKRRAEMKAASAKARENAQAAEKNAVNLPTIPPKAN